MQRVELDNGNGPYDFQCIEQDEKPVSAEVNVFSGPDNLGNSSTVILLSEAPENEGPSLSGRIPQFSRQFCDGIGIDNPAAPSVRVFEYQPPLDEKPEAFREVGLQWRQDGLMTVDALRTRELSREQMGNIIGEENLPPLTNALSERQNPDLSQESFTGAAAERSHFQEYEPQRSPHDDIGIDI